MISVIINGVICPTVNQDSILITKRIIDIENPEQKPIEHSKGFLIENTPAVAALFGQIFEVNLEIQNTSATNFTPDFNPNLKAKCTVMNDNTACMNGYCQMIDIVVLDDNKIAYNINAYAAVGNFFNEIKNSVLEDIDFSDLDHAWTTTNVVNSWSPTLGVGYVYPMIDYGLTNKYDTWPSTYFRPAVFVKEIIDRIFAAVGWSYTSAFFTSTRFKSLIIPYSAESLFISNSQIYDRSFLVGRATTDLTQTTPVWYLYKSGSPIIFNAESGLLVAYTLHDTSDNAYDTTTGKWTSTANGKFQFGCSLLLKLVNNTGIPVTSGAGYVKLIKDVGGTLTLIEQIAAPFTFSGTTSDQTTINYTSAVIDVLVGDVYYWTVGECYVTYVVGGAVNRIPSNGSNIDVKTLIGSVSSLIPQSVLVYGDTIDMNSLLPKNNKQTDFIMSISKMFNLYFEQTEDKKLLIEPREDYLTADIIDWTTKIDIGQDVTYTPMGMNQQKRYKFTYEEDADMTNQRYFKAYQQVYGTHLEDITTDFLTETKEIKPIFAATPLSDAGSGSTNIIKSDMKFVDDFGLSKIGQTKLRILYWGGLLTCTSWTFKEQITSPTGVAYTVYPYAGHLDNPYDATFDLCFGQPEAIYYDNNIGGSGNVSYTDANLFNIYWYQTIKEYTNRNSKILEAWFNLSVFDFVTLSFRKQYFIRNAYYRLLEVNDYDISGTQLVKCKLIKVSREAALVTSSKEVFGGKGLFDAGGKIPTKNLPPVSDGTAERTDKDYDGSNGYITGQGSKMYGSNNTIPNSAPDSYIFGSNGVVITQERGFVFNSDNHAMLRAGAVFNNVYLEYKQDTSVTATYLQTIDASTQATILPALATNEHYEITKFYLVQGAGTTYAWTGLGDIELKSGLNVVGTILGVDWLAGSENDISVGTTTTSQDFGEDITIEISGTYASGNAAMRIIIFYKIIQV
jgi:hypothetical protein